MAPRRSPGAGAGAVWALGLAVTTLIWACAPTLRGHGIRTPATGRPPPATGRAEPHLAFSGRSVGPAASVFGLDFARFTAVRALPSGDVVILGLAQGWSRSGARLSPPASRAFVARIEPLGGTIRWVHFLELARPQVCHTYTDRPVLLDVDHAGQVFVGAFVAEGDARAPRRPGGDRDPGPVVVSYDAGGHRRWVLHPGGKAATGAYVAGLAARDDGGVDLALAQADGPRLVRASATGAVETTRPLAAHPLEPLPCGPYGDAARVAVDGLGRSADGGLLVHGTFDHVGLALGHQSLAAPPRRAGSSGFWAVLDPAGRPVSLRRHAGRVEAWAPADGTRVLEVERAGEQRRVRFLDVRTGTEGPLLRVSHVDTDPLVRRVAVAGGQPLASIQQGGPRPRVYGGVTVRTSAAAPTSSAAIVAELAPGGRIAGRPRVIYGRALGGPDTHFGGAFVSDLLVRGDGTVVAVGQFLGRLETGGQKVISRQAHVPCGPGRAGEEHPIAPGCTEAVDVPAGFLVAWRPGGAAQGPAQHSTPPSSEGPMGLPL